MRQTVLITGCTTGSAGNALAREYSSRGLHVFATSRKIETMEDLTPVPNITLLQLDVTNLDSIRAARDKVQDILSTSTAEGGTLDLLVNNAGIAATKPALDHSLEATKQMFDTNVFGMMSMIQEFVPLLVKSKDPCIVNIGSNAALVPYAFGSSYNASKAAVHSYSDTLRLELKPLGIKVVTVILGGVKSNIYSYARQPLLDSSYYKPIEEEFTKTRRDGRNHATAPDVAARRLANATLKRNPPRRLYLAAGSTLMMVMSIFVPLGILDWLISKFLSLNRLATIRKEAGKNK